MLAVASLSYRPAAKHFVVVDEFFPLARSGIIALISSVFVVFALKDPRSMDGRIDSGQQLP